MRFGWVKGALVASAATAALGLGACEKVYGEKSAAPPAQSIEELMRQMQAQQQQPAAPPADPAAMRAFLTENGKKPGVTTTASGLQYKVVRAGPAGPTLVDGDVVKVNYEGALVDGTPFDASQPGAPAEFTVGGQLVPGFNEALRLMKVGDVFMVYMPANLAYGDTPQPGSPIPPGAVLVFKMEIVSKAGGTTANG